MGHKFHRGFTAAEKTELWDRWKRGESLKAIGRAFGKGTFRTWPVRLTMSEGIVAPQANGHRDDDHGDNPKGFLHTQSSLIDAFVLGSPRWLGRREHPHVFNASATALLSLTSTYRQMRNHQTR